MAPEPFIPALKPILELFITQKPLPDPRVQLLEVVSIDNPIISTWEPAQYIPAV
jgi:hypothetical protein